MTQFDAVAVVIVIFNYNDVIRIQFARVGMMYRKFHRQVQVDVAVAAAASTVVITGYFDNLIFIREISRLILFMSCHAFGNICDNSFPFLFIIS